MGLCRTFSLYVEDKHGSWIYDLQLTEQIIERLQAISGYGWDGNLDDGEQAWVYEVNWYDWEDDMKKLAGEYPNFVFTLHCEGMSLDDTWDAGFCENRMEVQGAYIPDLNYVYLRGQPTERA